MVDLTLAFSSIVQQLKRFDSFRYEIPKFAFLLFKRGRVSSSLGRGSRPADHFRNLRDEDRRARLRGQDGLEERHQVFSQGPMEQAGRNLTRMFISYYINDFYSFLRSSFIVRVRLSHT